MLPHLRLPFPTADFGLLAAVLLLPLLAFFVCTFFGKRLGSRAVRLTSLSTAIGAFLGSLVTCVAVTRPLVEASPAVRFTWKAWHWFDVTGRARAVVPIDVAFSVDAIGATMMVLVTGLGLGVLIHTTTSKEASANGYRYVGHLNLLLFSMLVLVTADNLLVLFAGWQAISICSYLLLQPGDEGDSPSRCRKHVLVVNRIGDVGLLVAMAMLVYYAGTLNWTGLERAAGPLTAERTVWSGQMLRGLPSGVRSALTPEAPIRAMIATLVGSLVVLAAATKSAQVPFHRWQSKTLPGLPSASALIHTTCTLVAGVYLIARMSFILTLSPAAMTLVTVMGALTAAFGAMAALGQNDLQKAIGYACLSQVGFMFVGLGSGALTASLGHLMVHACFAGCLFLCSGAIAQQLRRQVGSDSESRDMRNMGGLRTQMPITHAAFAASCLTAAGIAPLSGYWSMNRIVPAALDHRIVSATPGAFTAPAVLELLVVVVSLIALGCLSVALFRVYFLVFWGEPALTAAAAKDAPVGTSAPFTVLAGMGLLSGLLYAKPLAELTGVALFSTLDALWLPAFAIASRNLQTAPESNIAIAALITLIPLGAIAFCYWVYVGKNMAAVSGIASRTKRLRGWLDRRSKADGLVASVGRSMADFAATWDRLAIDGLTTKAPRFLAAGFGHALRLLHTGRPQWQAAAAVMGLVLMGWYILSPHANATVDARGLTGPHSTRGTVRFEAAPGHGYRYRWHVEGQPPPKQFTTKRTFSFVLQRCEQKTAVLTVKNPFGRRDRVDFTHCRESRPGCCRDSDSNPPKPKARAQNRTEAP